MLKMCFISSYPPNRARVSEYAGNLVTELAKRPAIGKIYVLADTIDGSNSVAESSKVEVLRIWKPDNIFSILSIVLRVLKLNPDVVHFNVQFQSFGSKRLANFIGLSMIPFCRILGLRVVATMHNLGEKVDLTKVGIKPSLLNKVGIFVATKLMTSASRVVVLVRSYAKYLRTHHSVKSVVYIPHGASISNCSRLVCNEKVVLMFGHMGPSKGLPVMLNAFKELINERDDVRLVVAGSSHPNFPGYLNKFAKTGIPKVDFLGFVNEEDVPRVIGMANVVALPYFAAPGTSGVFHLACGCGKPVVASDLPEIREMVSEGASALLVPFGDVRSLKNALLSVLLNEDMAIKMGAQNLMFARNEQWSIVAKAYEQTYLELLS